MENLLAKFTKVGDINKLIFYNDDKIVNEYHFQIFNLSKVVLQEFLDKIQRFEEAEFDFYLLCLKYIFSCTVDGSFTIKIIAGGTSLIINLLNTKINESLWNALNDFKDTLIILNK
jgi:hypothetical protein